MTAAEQEAGGLRASDAVAFGQEFGRVLSDGRIVGRAEPFVKVFPSSREVKPADANGQWLQVTVWPPTNDDQADRPWLATDLAPVPAHCPDDPERQATPPAVHANIVDMYARSIADVLGAARPPASVAPILHPTLQGKFRRLVNPLARGPASIRRTFVQTGYPRIEIAAAVRIRDRTFPLALGLNVSSGSPEIDTIKPPHLKIKADRQAHGHALATDVTTSTAPVTSTLPPASRPTDETTSPDQPPPRRHVRRLSRPLRRHRRPSLGKPSHERHHRLGVPPLSAVELAHQRHLRPNSLPAPHQTAVVAVATCGQPHPVQHARRPADRLQQDMRCVTLRPLRGLRVSPAPAVLPPAGATRLNVCA